MKNLKQYVKEEIKHHSALLKESKPLERQLRSLWDRKLTDTPEYQAKQLRSRELNQSYRISLEMRYLYLAYAKIRGRDWTKLEKYPEKIDEKNIDSAVEYLQSKFNSLAKEVSDV